MEEERKGKNKIGSNYGILVILLFATVAFLTDYIIIERKIRVCECPKCETTNNEVISDNIDNTQVTEENKNENNMFDYLVYNDYGKFIVTKDGNVYCSELDGINMSDSNIFIPSSVEVDDYLVSIQAGDNTFNGYKLNINNVRSLFSYGYGQQGFDEAVVFLGTDGKVSILYLTTYMDDEKYYEFDKNIDGFENIVSIVKNSTAGGSGLIAIDNNGKMFKLPIVTATQIKAR